MKKITLLACLFVLFNACSGGDEGEETISCARITSFTISPNIDKLNYTISSDGTPSFYEISLGESTQVTGAPDNGSIIPTTTPTGVIDLEQIGIIYQGMTLTAHARAVCADGSRGEWSTGVTFLVPNYCRRPVDISYGGGLSWQDRNWGSASAYQIKYGETGFTGNGTVYNTSSTYFTGIPLAAQTSYDFYVRSNCGGSNWSAWEGPYTYFSEYNENMCLAPTNLSYTVTYQSGSMYYIEINYNGNGENQFEYALVNGTGTPANSQLTTITSGYMPAYTNLSIYNTYKFWMRAVCADGSRTAWSTMTVDE